MLGGTHNEVETAAVVIHLRHRLAGHVDTYERIKVGHRYAVQLQHLALGLYLKLRTLHLLLHVKVGNALDVAYGGLNLVAEVKHLVQVIAEKLDGYAGLRAAQHGVYAVTYGLANLDVGTGNDRQAVAHVIEKLLVRTVLELERSLDFRHVDAQRVLVKLGAAGLSRHGLYLGHRHQYLFGAAPYLVRLVE